MINSKLTVVMYHYVRDLRNSRYPNIKGLDVNLFEKQVDYFKKNYTPVTMEMVIEAFEIGTPLPSRALLLTFDDGYVDHFINVFPILKNREIQGSFFAPVKAIMEHVVLDVNKIHFILASCNNIQNLLSKIKSLLKKYTQEYNLESYEYYYQKLANENRFDTANVIFIKRLLQTE